MKKTLFILTFVFISTFVFSQSSSSIARTQLNAGVGFSGWGIPFYIGLDFRVHNDITLGAEFSYRSYRENYKDYYYHHGIMGFSGNANYHFNRILAIPDPWDFYAGLNIGFYVWTSPNTYYGTHSSGLGLGAQVGCRYFLNDRVGLNLELGGGNAFSGGKFGLTIKL